ncbi:U-actitoxin-Avd3l-like [Drosophila subpulchrella]|uniref:U-actitoxin-Avd3l-like n=1 Tax=Drosophila subpulchrella TaxID=1486046 RepID=UPI0018A18183|nr:U-actitoxin-Avd3l-like [Drosophila subpulchrella]
MRITTLILIAVLMVFYLTVDVTGVARCKGKPGTSKCIGNLDGGNNRKRKCKKSANKDMWHYNAVTKNCTKINYLGCGGNDNRWCTKVLCEGCRPR